MRRQNGRTLPWVLALIACLGLIVLYWQWKGNYGKFGHVDGFDFDSVDHIGFIRQTPDGQTNIFSVLSDGTGEKKLTDDPSVKSGLDWSPDGKQLVYCAETADEKYRAFQVYLLGKDGSRQATNGTGSKQQPKFGPNGKEIAFVVGGALKSMDTNGENMEQLYPSPHRDSPDAENSANPGQQSEGDGGKRPPISNYKWSPLIGGGFAAIQVFEGDEAVTNGQSDWWQKKPGSDPSAPSTIIEPESLLYIPDGNEKPTIRRDANATFVSFGWFPDGKQVAVAVSARQNAHALMILRPDQDAKDSPPGFVYGSTGMTVRPENPVVSPTGDKIAVELRRLDSADNSEMMGIAVFSTNSSDAISVKNTSEISKLDAVLKVKGHATNPKWSPDGKKLLYLLTDASGHRDIWVCNADGSGQKNITQGKGDHFDVSWSPAIKK